MKKLLTTRTFNAAIVISVLLLICLLTVDSYANAGSEYWPTWRGPDLTGVSRQGNPPAKWSETENVKWKVKLTGDASNSSPIIWGDKIFFQTAVDIGIKDETHIPVQTVERPGTPGSAGGRPSGREGAREDRGRRVGGFAPTPQFKFNLLCVDRRTGKVLWEATACQVKPHQGHHPDNGFASFSPVTDGEFVWATFGSRGIYCYDLDGKRIWSKELPQLRTRYGEAGSPSLASDAVVVTADPRGIRLYSPLIKRRARFSGKRPVMKSFPIPLLCRSRLTERCRLSSVRPT